MDNFTPLGLSNVTLLLLEISIFRPCGLSPGNAAVLLTILLSRGEVVFELAGSVLGLSSPLGLSLGVVLLSLAANAVVFEANGS